MKKSIIAATCVVLAMILLLACAPKAAPAPAPQAPAAAKPVAPAPVPQALAKPAWQVEWDKVVEAAKKEGKVVIITSGGGEMRSYMAKGVADSGYGISFEAIAGKGGELSEKIQSERRAGLYSFDVWVGGTTTMASVLKPNGILAPLEPALILPEVTDPGLKKKIWWRGDLWWIDKERYLLAMQLTPDIGIGINTNLIKPGEFTSWYDLLDPKWKGKVVLNDPTVAGAGSTLPLFMKNTLGWEFMEKLAKTEPFVLRDQRLMIDWLAQGKVAIAVPLKTDTFIVFKKAGAPVTSVVPKEGVWMSAGSGGLGLITKAPHPNAAKVFINWFLSKEGQIALINGSGEQSLREDVTIAHLPPENVRKEGVPYFVKEQEEVLLEDASLKVESKKLFGHLVK